MGAGRRVVKASGRRSGRCPIPEAASVPERGARHGVLPAPVQVRTLLAHAVAMLLQLLLHPRLHAADREEQQARR